MEVGSPRVRVCHAPDPNIEAMAAENSWNRMLNGSTMDLNVTYAMFARLVIDLQRNVRRLLDLSLACRKGTLALFLTFSFVTLVSRRGLAPVDPHPALLAATLCLLTGSVPGFALLLHHSGNLPLLLPSNQDDL